MSSAWVWVLNIDLSWGEKMCETRMRSGWVIMSKGADKKRKFGDWTELCKIMFTVTEGKGVVIYSGGKRWSFYDWIALEREKDYKNALKRDLRLNFWLQINPVADLSGPAYPVYNFWEKLGDRDNESTKLFEAAKLEMMAKFPYGYWRQAAYGMAYTQSTYHPPVELSPTLEYPPNQYLEYIIMECPAQKDYKRFKRYLARRSNGCPVKYQALEALGY